MRTYKIIGGDEKEYGPAEPADLVEWIGEGRLSGQSRAMLESDGIWKPLSEFPEFAEALRNQALGFATVQPPIAPKTVARGEIWKLAGNGQINVGSCFYRAWELLSANFALLFGGTFLVWIIGTMLQFLPIVGAVYWLLRGVLYGGLFLLYLSCIRGKEASMGEVFSGFGAPFRELVLVGIVTSFLSSVGFLFCVVPWVYLTIIWIFSVPLVADRRMGFWPAMELSRKAVTRVWGQVFVLALLAFLPVIMAHIMTELKIATAMLAAARETWGTDEPNFAKLLQEMPKLMTQVAQTSTPYLLMTKVVLLLNLPLAVGALMYAYEDLFGKGPADRP